MREPAGKEVKTFRLLKYVGEVEPCIYDGLKPSRILQGKVTTFYDADKDKFRAMVSKGGHYWLKTFKRSQSLHFTEAEEG